MLLLAPRASPHLVACLSLQCVAFSPSRHPRHHGNFNISLSSSRYARPLPANDSRMRLNLPRACRPQSLQTITTSPCARRSYAFHAPGGAVFKVFNSRTKWYQKERAAANPELGRQADYLKDEVAMRVCERLLVRFLASQLKLSSTRNQSTPRSNFPLSRISNASSPTSSTSAPTPATSPGPSHARTPILTRPRPPHPP